MVVKHLIENGRTFLALPRKINFLDGSQIYSVFITIYPLMLVLKIA